MQIPGYEIEKEIGSGGLATVYLAVQSSLHRHVALKVIKPELTEDEKFTDRFLREGKSIAQLDHPNIVRVFEIGSSEQNHYLSMEFLPGGNLQRQIERGIELERAMDILRTVAGALGYAHEQGMLHLNLKPQNILFRDGGTPVVTDFGIAKAADSNPEITATLLINRSLSYVSVERVSGNPVDARSDLYSLGILFYQMLTGELPYRAKDNLALALMHVNEPVPEFPSRFAVYQPVLNRLLAKNPNDRFASVQELIDILNRAENDPESLVEETREIPVYDPLETSSPQDTAARQWMAKLSGLRQGREIKTPALLLAALAVLGLLITGVAWLFDKPSEESVIEPVPEVEPSQSESPPAEPAEEAPAPVAARVDESTPAEPVVDSTPASVSSTEASPVDFPPLENPEITRLLERAEEQMAASRLVAPPDENAYETYRQVLALDPQNAQAQDGLSGIVSRLLERGETQLEASQLTTPIGDNAYESFSWALELDPDNARAQEGIARIVSQFLDRGEQQLQAGRLIEPPEDGAVASFNWVLGLDPDNARAQEGISQIVSRLLERGERQLRESRLTTPGGDNAFETYQQVLDLDPDNQQAEEGFVQIVSKYLRLAELRKDQENYRTSLALIDRGLRVIRERRAEQESARLNALRRQLLSLRAEVVEARERPRNPEEPLYAQVQRLMEDARSNSDWCVKRAKLEEALWRIKQGLDLNPSHNGLLRLRNEGWSMHAQALRECP